MSKQRTREFLRKCVDDEDELIGERWIEPCRIYNHSNSGGRARSKIFLFIHIHREYGRMMILLLLLSIPLMRCITPKKKRTPQPRSQKAGGTGVISSNFFINCDPAWELAWELAQEKSIILASGDPVSSETNCFVFLADPVYWIRRATTQWHNIYRNTLNFFTRYFFFWMFCFRCLWIAFELYLSTLLSEKVATESRPRTMTDSAFILWGYTLNIIDRQTAHSFFLGFCHLHPWKKNHQRLATFRILGRYSFWSYKFLLKSTNTWEELSIRCCFLDSERKETIASSTHKSSMSRQIQTSNEVARRRLFTQ